MQNPHEVMRACRAVRADQKQTPRARKGDAASGGKGEPAGRPEHAFRP